jgi:hypothetical protein
VFHLLAGVAPEADDAIRKLAGWVRPKLGLGLAPSVTGSCHCEERSDAAISIVVRDAMGIASLRSQ